VLVITKQEEREPSLAETGNERASDILARRLPSVPDQPPAVPAHPASLTPKTNAVATVPSGPAATSSAAGTQPASLGASQLTTPKVTALKPRATQPSTDVPASAQSATENPGQSTVRTITDDAPTPAPIKPVVKTPAPAANPQSKPEQPESDQQ
jgi:hypothetical protein